MVHTVRKENREKKRGAIAIDLHPVSGISFSFQAVEQTAANRMNTFLEGCELGQSYWPTQSQALLLHTEETQTSTTGVSVS